MKVFVKICGLACAEDVAAVAALRPDALGFVFWPRSPRAVTPEQVADWTRTLPPDLLKVGVFVDPTPEELRGTVTTARLDVVQWHGFPSREAAAGDWLPDLPRLLSGISKERCHPVGRASSPACSVKIWQVVRVGPAGAPAPFVDAVVLDSYSPVTPGGTGQTVDWAAARAWVAASPRPVLLAGGLRPDNVVAALRAVQPWGVDVSSGVEARPGRKDLAAVKRFIELCRAC